MFVLNCNSPKNFIHVTNSFLIIVLWLEVALCYYRPKDLLWVHYQPMKFIPPSKDAGLLKSWVCHPGTELHNRTEQSWVITVWWSPVQSSLWFDIVIEMQPSNWLNFIFLRFKQRCPITWFSAESLFQVGFWKGLVSETIQISSIYLLLKESFNKHWQSLLEQMYFTSCLSSFYVLAAYNFKLKGLNDNPIFNVTSVIQYGWRIPHWWIFI